MPSVLEDQVTETPAITSMATTPLHHCYHCRRIVETLVDIQHSLGGSVQRLCVPCSNNRTSVCGTCNTRRYNDNMRSANLTPYCLPCYNRMPSCYNCGHRYAQGAVLGLIQDRPYCQRCFESHHREEERRLARIKEQEELEASGQDYEATYSTVRDASTLGFKGDPPDHLYFGIELETEVGTNNTTGRAISRIRRNTKGFTIQKQDGSLQRGIEIVSAPASFNYHKTAWDKFFEDLPKGLTSHESGRCGIHIHVSRKGFTTLDGGKVAVFINKRCNGELVKLIAGRYDASYCNIIDSQAVIGGALNGNSKYSAVNCSPSNTIEVRIFRGTLNKVCFFKNLEFVHSLFQWVKVTDVEKLVTAEYVAWLEQNSSEYPNLTAFLIANKVLPNPFGLVIDPAVFTNV